MSDQSGGPGWWVASDGKWYSPRWEYQWAKGHLNAKKHLEDIEVVVAELGLQGWEAVNAFRDLGTMSSGVTVLMKRPVV